MSKITTRNLCLERDGQNILNGASMEFRTGELVAIIGPNGAGKSSLIKTILGLVQPVSGEVMIDDQPISGLSSHQRARLISYLPQIRPLAWPVAVREIVALGRYAFGMALSPPSGSDALAISKAMEMCGLGGFENRRSDSLSGGELARVHCARAFCAETPFLFADEPTANLDLHHQFAVMDLFRARADAGASSVVVLHDVVLAARFADRIVCLNHGEVAADGPPLDALTKELMRDVFRMDAEFGPSAQITVRGTAKVQSDPA